MPPVRQASRHEIEIRTVCRIMLHRPLRQLLRRQNIDLTERSWRAFDDMVFRALHRCAHCKAREACQQWLAEPHPGETHPAFCPNATVIAACRILDPKGAAPTQAEGDIAGQREPPIAELLADPIIQQLMNADGIEPHQFRSRPIRGPREAKTATEQAEHDA